MTTQDKSARPSAALVSGRVPGLEFGRWVAACAIVWLHGAAVGPKTVEWIFAGRFAVPFFTLLAVALTVRSVVAGRSPSAAVFARDRFVRLYLPFLFWTVVYLALRFIKNAGSPGTQPFVGLHLLFVGSTHHLWYLPFVFFATVFARVIAPYLATLPRRSVVAGLVLIGLTLCWRRFGVAFRLDDPDPLNQLSYFSDMVVHVSPSVAWGLALGFRFEAIMSRLTGRQLIVGVATVVTAGLLWLGADETSAHRRLCENVAGISFFMAAAALPAGGWLATAGRLGAYSFGIYVLHVGFVQLIEKLLNKPRQALDLTDATVMTLGAIIGSMAVTWLLLRFRVTAWLAR